jgi:predicted KAP-like P-loop ATPase
MLQVRPKWMLSKDFIFSADGKEVARLIKPLSLILFDAGRFQFQLQDGREFEATVPRRAVVRAVTREVAMNLLLENKTIATLTPGTVVGTTEQGFMTWNERKFLCQMKGLGEFIIIENDREIGAIRTLKAFGRQRTLDLPPEIPLEVQMLFFLGTIQPRFMELFT